MMYLGPRRYQDKARRDALLLRQDSLLDLNETVWLLVAGLLPETYQLFNKSIRFIKWEFELNALFTRSVQSRINSCLRALVPSGGESKLCI